MFLCYQVPGSSNIGFLEDAYFTPRSDFTKVMRHVIFLLSFLRGRSQFDMSSKVIGMMIFSSIAKQVK